MDINLFWVMSWICLGTSGPTDQIVYSRKYWLGSNKETGIKGKREGIKDEVSAA